MHATDARMHGGAKNGNIASAWELYWESIMKINRWHIIGTTIKALQPPPSSDV